MEDQTMTISKLPIPPRRNVVPIAYAGKEAPKLKIGDKIPPPAKSPTVAADPLAVAAARNGTHSNIVPPATLPAGTMIDGYDCGGMTDDPKKAGIPVWLQTQNRKALTPEQLARVKAHQTKARADEKAKQRERAEMAKQLGMAPTEMRKHGAKLKSETKSKEATVKKNKTTKAKTNGHAKRGSKVELIGKLLQRENGCTTADVLKACEWPSVSMPQQAKLAGLRLRKEKAKGEATRYYGTPAK
jgi:hypothetical protein